MSLTHMLCLSGLLFGIGIGTSLYRKNLLGILMGSIVSGGGLVLLFTAFFLQSPHTSDGMLFAICLLGTQFLGLVVGAGIVFRRHMQGRGLEEGWESEP